MGQVMDAVMAHAARQAQLPDGGAISKGQLAQLPSWRQAVDDTGAEAERGAEALGKLVEAWQGVKPPLGRAKIMPFVDAES